MFSCILRVAVIELLLVFVFGDPNDWVNVEYVISQAKDQRSTTSAAKTTIVRNADSAGGKGPWAVTNSENILPPSKDSHDYLSWAPYHWPSCNWCTQAGRTHLAHTAAGVGKNTTDTSGTASLPDPNDPYSNESVFSRRKRRYTKLRRSETFDVDIEPEQGVSPALPSPNTMSKISNILPTSSVLPLKPTVMGYLPTQFTSSTTDGRAHGPAQAAAKTTKASCTPSPTKSLAPSATWTTCAYVGHDGQVNPDVRILNGPDAINDVAQAVIYNAIAYALQKTSKYSTTVANSVYAFFLAPATKMNPNMNFGQIVRGLGPDGVSGTFTGVLDLRGLVKIINGICIVKAAGSPDWTQALDDQMNSWLSDYVNWLTTSSIGRITASRPNNHGTFYVSQVAAAKLTSGDRKGAAAVLQEFCSTTFLDQVARTGEQPFEAVRTRPYHYRNFNLEALITNAKIGDQLGLNLWSCKSKYGATIQTALDFVLTVNPGSEDVGQILPHVASVAAAYGDPTGKYATFLKKKEPNYQLKSYWFYDQPGAIPSLSSSTKQARRFLSKRDQSSQGDGPDPVSGVEVPFECPAIFHDAVEVEIDNGVLVTCDELRPFYT